MALKFRPEGLLSGEDALEWHVPGMCFGGVSSGSQQSSSNQNSQESSQSNTAAQNFQNAPFVGNSQTTLNQLGNAISQAGVAGQIAGFGGESGADTGLASILGSYVAPVTGAQNNTLGSIGQVIGGGPNSVQGATNALLPTILQEGLSPTATGQAVAGAAPTSSILQSMANPNYAAGLATSPQTQSAIASALQPIRNQFATQTVPGLEGSFTQAGQRVGTEQGSGSSAFANAFANAQGSELATEAATAGSIANSAYQTGLGQELSAGEGLYSGALGEYNQGVNLGANAPSQASSLTTSELSNLVNGLNAQALPQLTQQYGINTGISTYNSMMGTILQALGLETQGEQPSLGYLSNSSSQGTSQGSSQGSGSNSGFNLANPFSVG